MTKFSKFIIILLLLIFLLAAGIFLWNRHTSLAPADNFKKDAVENLNVGEVIKQDGGKTTEKNNEAPTDNAILPERIFIKVPFTSQAPYANWDERHEEACEEASLIMVAYYIQNKKLNREVAEKEIQDLINFQLEKYGDYKDSDAAGVVKLASDYYNIKNLTVIYDFKKEEIKKQLAKGNPVIIPAAGRKLENPNYTYPGPLYHMLVLVGYDGNTIITNDPGTRKGEGYKYDIDVLFKAIHDFPGNIGEIEKGRKAMIVITSE